MTEELYLDDDSVTTFEATVERRIDNRVVLDRTHFYPTGGGQPHDTGTLRTVETDTAHSSASDGAPDRSRWRVVDVQKSDTVYHTLAAPDDDAGTERSTTIDPDEAVDPPTPGTRVVGTIDTARRTAHARYHTAQHLLSALLLAEFDAETTGNQLYRDHAHLDAAYDRFDETDLAQIERRLNELVADARPVDTYTMDRKTAEATLDTDRTRIDLLPESITELRIVEIGSKDTGGESVTGASEPFDRTACAGTHVTNTRAIGDIRVTGRETKGSEEERIHVVLAAHAENA